MRPAQPGGGSHEYLTANVDVILRLRQRKDAQSFDAYRRFLRSGLRVFATYRKQLSRLAPPRILRRNHRLLLGRSTRTLATGRRLMALLDRGQIAAVRGGARLTLSRVMRQAQRADAASAAIRRILRAPGGGRTAPAAPQGNQQRVEAPRAGCYPM